MNLKKVNVSSYFVLTFLLVMAFAIINGKAGSLEPTAPPGPTMVTLDQLSAKIDALSSPVEKVVRGIITLPSTTGEQAVDSNEQNLPVAVDPNHCVVLLSDAVASEHVSTSASYWEGRTGVCVTAFTTTTIKVRGEGLRSEQKVSYQIIQYK
jgi:hypothetical protein